MQKKTYKFLLHIPSSLFVQILDPTSLSVNM